LNLNCNYDLEDNRILPSLHPFLIEYLKTITTLFPNQIEGAYLYGSLCLGAYQEGKSDIDLLVVLNRNLTTEEIKRLRKAHKQLRKYYYGRLMDGMYLSVADLGKQNHELDPYPYCFKGKIKFGYWDVNAVTWWLLKHKGIRLYGTDISELDIPVHWGHVIDTMKYNLNEYWMPKTKQTFSFLVDEMVEFCVLTLSRIICTYEFGEILAKQDAVKKAQDLVPIQWQLLLKEGLRIRINPQSASLYPSRIKRARECKAWIAYVKKLYFERS
jgi:predicted nucleotidyltransferase